MWSSFARKGRNDLRVRDIDWKIIARTEALFKEVETSHLKKEGMKTRKAKQKIVMQPEMQLGVQVKMSLL